MSDLTLAATTSHIHHLSDLFQAASIINNQGLIILKENGIVIYTESNHIISNQTTIDISLFSNYTISNNNESIDAHKGIGVDLSLISHAFEVLDNREITCYLSYKGEGSPFVLEFEDNLMSETIEFLTFYPDINYPYNEEDQQLELIFDNSDIMYEVMLKSDLLTNVLQDLQQINTRELFIYLSCLGHNELSFISNGPIGLAKLIYPNEKTILERLEILTDTTAISSFTFSNFIKIFKSVKLSSKCKIMKDSQGIFSVQLICKDPTNLSYLGTVININMLELDQTIDMNEVEKFFVDQQLPNKRRKTNASEITKVDQVPLFL